MRYDVEISVPPRRALIAIRARPDAAGRAGKAFGFVLPGPGFGIDMNNVMCLPMAADEWLVGVKVEKETETYEALDRAINGIGGAIAVVSDAYVCVRIQGPDTLAVLVQALAQDVHESVTPVGAAWRGTFGRSAALMHRIGPTTFDVYADITLERYVTRYLKACAGT
ncbi:MAG: hypothetical protein HOI95_08625 [Chromatiales bacterium]|jgi:heterotetrameric sarcosine oxidase gamma subunit|nr:hypothetical protein [Chromatiales bacterium]